ncbi:chemotaxis protein MotB [Caldicoprobacter guelmensis]|uniref:OmpA/MotB family protein n=1 Tax=Caldicoprobacter guelmensis TaxID=1170224 RepID=UPI00195B5F03|nr:flagellar motor protein MotB [Caldicoprobacter guelmensis]MBM7581388.1 chemotaxis protein MotB [Caldicoprobacter guelmensis]
MKRRRKREKSGGIAEWFVTYSDMVTLLLTFFVMLYSFSVIDAQKWEALVESLRGSIGILQGGTSIGDTPRMRKEGPSSVNLNELIGNKAKQDKQGEKSTGQVDPFLKLYEQMSQYIVQNEIPAQLELSPTQTEILIRFKDYVLFDVGKAELKPEAKEILDRIAKILLNYIDQIDRVRVEGHTDTQPINTIFYPTNWELSADRAIKVVRYFQEKHGFPGNKLSGEGYGEYYPIASNATEEGRAKNRRVDVQIVKAINAEKVQTIE